MDLGDAGVGLTRPTHSQQNETPDDRPLHAQQARELLTSIGASQRPASTHSWRMSGKSLSRALHMRYSNLINDLKLLNYNDLMLLLASFPS